MVSKGAIAAGVIAVGAVAALAYAASSKSQQGIAKIRLASSLGPTIMVGQNDVFTAMATDSAGTPVANAKITFMPFNESATTNGSGVAQWGSAFAQPGTYNVYATG